MRTLPASCGTLNEAASMANDRPAAPALVDGLGPSPPLSTTATGRIASKDDRTHNSVRHRSEKLILMEYQ